MTNDKLITALVVASTFTLFLPLIAKSDCSGIYLGIQGGYTRSHYDLHTFLDRDFKKDERAGRAYLGYQMNQYFGIETGFTMLAGTELPDSFGDVKTTHWDLLLKLGATLGDSGLRLDLKGGGTHIMSKFNADEIAKSVGLDDVTEWKIRPVAGASLTYYINKNIGIDVSYFHVFSHPESASFETPTVDLALLGVSILFTTS